MGLWLVLGLGVLQGLTEFLPVSSSGHLRLFAAWFGVQDPQLLFDILMHVGTLVAVFIVYRRLLLDMLLATFRVVRRPGSLADEPYAKVVLYGIVGTIPTGIIAVLAGDTMESAAAATWVVGAALVVNGFILLLLGRVYAIRANASNPGRTIEEMTLRDALIVGTVQGMGIFRGISRSGSTITAGLLTGLRQDAATAFSFVLAIPAILGALVLKFDASALATDGTLGLYLAGAATSAVVGTVALIYLKHLMDVGKLHLFAWYCFPLGVVAITLDLL